METLRTDDPSYVGPIRLLGRLGAGGMGRLTYADGRRGRVSDLTRAGGLVQIGPPEITSTGRADLTAALIRPDGAIAWAAPGDSPETLAVARAAWGDPEPMSSGCVASLVCMTTPTTASPGRPPVVDLATWQAARDELLVREKAHTRAGDALAADRRRLPMVEIDGTTEVVGADGPVPFLDLFQGRDELVIYHHMWHDGVPHQGQCAGCTFNVWQMKDTVYLKARGVSFAILTSGRWDEVAPFVAFMGYEQPWYSVRGVEAQIATDEGHIVCYLRDGDRAFLTYRTTGRGNEPADGNVGLLDMTPYGRGEAWEDNPEGWPEGHHSCWYWATDPDGNATWGPTSRPAPQWTRPNATPVDGPGQQG